MKTSTEIQEMIKNIPLDPLALTDELAESLIPILEALNRRLDVLEANQKQSQNVFTAFGPEYKP